MPLRQTSPPDLPEAAGWFRFAKQPASRGTSSFAGH